MENNIIIRNKKYRILGTIASGAQGCVYKIEANDGERLALKVLFPTENDINYEKRLLYLNNILSNGLISEVMVYPRYVKKKSTGEVEYTMELLEGYSDCDKAWKDPRNYYPLNPETKFRIIRNIYHALDMLHEENLDYSDPSPQNILFNPSTGEVKYIDTDSISFSRVNNRNDFGMGGKSPVVGTGEFRAPESYRSNYDHDCYSDIFGLTIYVFRLLVGIDPFYGRK
nr:serine/threonine-protein kinase [Eubacterium sp.]